MHLVGDSDGVSPVIAVVLMVAISVVLAILVGVFVFDIGQRMGNEINTAGLAVDTQNDGGNLTISVVTGNADELRILSNGTEVANLSNPEPGDSLSINITPETEYSVVSVKDGEASLVSSYETRKTVSKDSNSPPVAYSNPNQTTIYEGETVSFDGSGSSDNDGDSLTYEWDFQSDGTIDATGVIVNHTYSSQGSYDASLTVTDSHGASSSDTVTITVDNGIPVSNMSANQTSIKENDTIAFDGSNSSDPDGDSLSYEWDFTTDGTVDATGVTTTHTYSSEGTYNATLTVTDSDGATDTDTVTITVSNGVPTALASANNTTVIEGEDIAFNGSDSSDLDGDSLSYDWDFQSDGTIDATGVTVVHSYSSTGTYNATLIVTDSDGASDKDGITITVESSTVLVEDFEDGNVSGWNKDTSWFSAQNYSVATGTYLGQLQAENGVDSATEVNYRFTENQPKEVYIEIGPDTQPASGRYHYVGIGDDGAGEWAQIRFNGNGTVSINHQSGESTTINYSTVQTSDSNLYWFRFYNIDWTNKEFELEIGRGNTSYGTWGPYPMRWSSDVNGFSLVWVRTNTMDAGWGTVMNMFVDHVKYTR